jgi:hypothetical protein
MPVPFQPPKGNPDNWLPREPQKNSLYGGSHMPQWVTPSSMFSFRKRKKETIRITLDAGRIIFFKKILEIL